MVGASNALQGERLGDANPAVQRQAVQVLLSLVRQLPAEQVSLKLEALWGNPSAAVRCGLLQVSPGLCYPPLFFIAFAIHSRCILCEFSGYSLGHPLFQYQLCIL